MTTRASPGMFALAVLCLTHCSAQGRRPRAVRSAGEPPRSWAVAKWLRFEGYRVALSPGWVARQDGASLRLRPNGVPGVLLEFQRIRKGPLGIVAFERSSLAARSVGDFPSPPVRGTTTGSHVPFLLYRGRGEPSKGGSIRERGAFVVFFPRSVLLVNMRADLTLGELAGQLGHEAKLIVERTLEIQ